jgi:hypothetical protein
MVTSASVESLFRVERGEYRVETSGLIPSGLSPSDFGLISSGLAIAAKLQHANNTSFNMFFALSGL